MSTIAVPPEDFGSWDTERLRAELVAALAWTAARLRHLAAVWAELDRRGEDLSELRRGLVYYLPLIASGAVSAEAVVQFAGSKTLLDAVARLPAEQQRELAAGGSVLLVIAGANGYERRSLPAHALTAAQVRQVFGERHVRNESEQIAALTTTAQAGRPARHGAVRVDRARKVAKVGQATCSLADLFAALRAAGYQIKDA